MRLLEPYKVSGDAVWLQFELESSCLQLVTASINAWHSQLRPKVVAGMLLPQRLLAHSLLHDHVSIKFHLFPGSLHLHAGRQTPLDVHCHHFDNQIVPALHLACLQALAHAALNRVKWHQ